jgi:protein-disulfide isomerase
VAKSGRQNTGGQGGGARPPAGNGKRPAGSSSRTVGVGSVKGRQSVAAARAVKPGSNRTQVIIGSVAIVVIAIIVVGAIILNKVNTAKPVDNYGNSTQSVATADSGGVITVNNGGNPPTTIDIYADMLCPICSQFEDQYGQQINQAVDQGKLTVRYHLLNFLNASSASKDYSTRAASALMCVAQDSATGKGVWLQYLEKLFSSGTQPAENGSSDLTNAQLADVATGLGVGQATASCITSGKNVTLAQTEATAGNAELQKAVGGVATPTVLQDGKPLGINSKDWLTNLLGS